MFLSTTLCLGYMRRQTQGTALDTEPTTHTHIYLFTSSFPFIEIELLAWCLYLALEYLSFLVDCEDSHGEQQ